MALSFSLGMTQFWNGLAEMQNRGFYWVNADSQEAAYRLCGQVLEAQQGVAPVNVLFSEHNLICNDPEKKLAEDDVLFTALKETPKQIFYYQLANGKKALLTLPADINRIRHTQSSLMILLLPASSWLTLNDKQLTRWMQGISDSADNKNSTCLILCYGAGINALKTQLHLYHRQISGVAELKTNIEPNQWAVSWWHDNIASEANTLYPLSVRKTGWEIQKNIPASVAEQTGDDQWMLLAERSVLEGAPRFLNAGSCSMIMPRWQNERHMPAWQR